MTFLIQPARKLAAHFLVVTSIALLVPGCPSQPGAVDCGRGFSCPEGTSCAAGQQVCIVTPCGNAVLDSGETCDDGNIIDGDGCSASCKVEDCGNGVQEGTEECDGNDVLACDSNEYCSNCDCVLSTTTVYYHFECQQNACVQVEGSGQSECNSDDDCVPPVIDCPAYCSG